MDNLRPQDLPAFLDPALDYLAEHLPPSLYDTLFTALSYGLMLFSGLFSLFSALPSWKPWEWDAQTVLPPLIIFLTAYYTLLSMYRTTSFMMRMAFRLIKWGTIFSVVGAGIGWLGANVENAGGGAMRDWGRTDAGSRGRTRRARPRPWESFDAHQQWQYDEQEARRTEEQGATSEAQQAIQYIAGLAGRVLGNGAFDILSGAKSFLDNVADTTANGADESGSGHDGGPRKKKAKRKAKASSKRNSASR